MKQFPSGRVSGRDRASYHTFRTLRVDFDEKNSLNNIATTQTVPMTFIAVAHVISVGVDDGNTIGDVDADMLGLLSIQHGFLRS